MADIERMNALLINLYRRLQSALRGYRLSRFRALRAVHIWVVRRLTQTLRPGIYKINGHPMYLSGTELSTGLSTAVEPDLINYVASTVKPGVVVLDIGAHIGIFAVPCAHRVGLTGRVIAFEPDPTNCESLRKNVELNGLSNVVIVEKAASSTTASAVLHLSANNTGGHSLHAIPSDSLLYPPATNHASVAVLTVTVDGWLAEAGISKVDFVKIDVEGYESAVLQGMQHTLQDNLEIQVVMEYWPWHLCRVGVPVERPLQLMADLGFRFYLLESPIKPVTANELTALRDSPMEGRLVLCRRASQI